MIPTPIATFAPLQLDASRPRTVVLDPGHGGDEVGSASGGYGEKSANLQIAFKVQALLEEHGIRVVLTRDSDRRAYSLPVAQNDRDQRPNRMDLQARVDIANATGADIFIAIHNNGSGDSGQAGTEVWVDSTRPQGRFSTALAEETLAALVAEIRATGYPVPNRGLKDAAHFRVFNGNLFPIFVLGGPLVTPSPTRGTTMPGILGETLFMSNPNEGFLLRQEYMQDAIARGYRTGILRYFQRLDAGELGPAPGRP